MKLMIDIPDKIYETVQNGTYCGTLYEELKNGTPLSESEDCVGRQAAINVAVDAVDDWDGGCNKTREEYIRKALETIHPVTPTKKVGHWEWDNVFWCRRCSECHLSKDSKWSNYCPNCGAKMVSPTGAERSDKE